MSEQVRCTYCKKFTENKKLFCDAICEEKHNIVIDGIVPRINSARKLTDEEIKMQQDFLKGKK